MSAIAQQAQVAKTVAVSTGKVANAKSMMVWRPHGNKYVHARLATRDRRMMKVLLMLERLLSRDRGSSFGCARAAFAG